MFNSNLHAKIRKIVLDAHAARKAAREELEYEKRIQASKDKLAETKLVPGYIKIYA